MINIITEFEKKLSIQIAEQDKGVMNKEDASTIKVDSSNSLVGN